MNTEKNIEFVMNPMQVELLKEIHSWGEHRDHNALYLHNATSFKLDEVNQEVERFGHLHLIEYRGGGYFVISEKGTAYLNEINAL